jgi:beta-galactosidase/beta-glucuronidase
MRSIDKENIPRPEYPRPQFVRESNWINLNGEWDFTFDVTNIGLKEKWYKEDPSKNFDKKIVVPFGFQSNLSGIGDTSFHEVIWYRREFKIPEEFHKKRILLHFGAVDYNCIVYLNGERVGYHEGGYVGFSLDITDFIQDINVLILRVEDPSQDLSIPRGKQYWQENLETIFYPRVSGIWQTVWLEFLSSECHLNSVKMIPNIDLSELMIEFHINGTEFSDIFLLFQILYDGKEIAREEMLLDFLGKFELNRNNNEQNKNLFPKTPNCFKFRVSIPNGLFYLWDVENPNLYDINFKIYNKKTDKQYDSVSSYFGMRKISVSEKKTSHTKQVLLNNNPIYQKLFLVQGYWPDGLYTAPSDDAIKKDIQFIKDFGFNGLRTHQKAFDPRFLYWCDKMGVLVWGEIGNAFRFNLKSQLRLLNEFVEEIERDYNHPSIIVWVPINEGWGIPGAEKDPKRAFYMKSLYNLVKSIDPNRLVIDNDGWWHTEANDICTRHFYASAEKLPKSMEEEINLYKKSVPKIYLSNNEYNNEPIIYSEMGGFGFDATDTLEDGWGYGKSLNTPEDLFNRVIQLFKEFDKRKDWIQGFCYTELYDQFQEVNGLLTMNRVPKFPPAKLKEQLDKMFY